MFSAQETVLLSTIKKMLDPSNQNRQETEKNILSWAKQTYSQILSACTKFSTCEELELEVRQYSCILLVFLFKNEYYENWVKIPVEFKTEIQNSLLGLLGNPNRLLRQVACGVVSSLEKISIKNNEWPKLIEILCNASESNENEFKISAIKTLGMIWEYLTKDKISNNDFILMEKSLIKILSNFSSNELSLEALRAYKLFLNYIPEKFKDKDYLEPTLKMLSNLCNINNKQLNEHVIIASIHRITEVSKIAYNYINDHFKNLAQYLCILCVGPSENLAIQAYIFFIEFSEHEFILSKEKKSKNYIDSIWDVLWPTIQNSLNNRINKKKDEENNNYSRYKALSTLLYNISQYCEISIMADIFQYVSNNIISNNISQISVAIYTFTSILETKYKTEMSDIVIKSIEPLSNYFNSNNIDLNNNLSWCFEKMCEIHGSLILTNNTLNNIVCRNVILTNLQNSKVDIKTKIRLCLALFNLTEVAHKDLVTKNLGIFLSFSDLLHTLDILAYQEKSYDNDFNYNLSRYCFLAIGGLLECSDNNSISIVNLFLERLLYRFNQTKESSFFNNKEKQIDYINNLCRCLSSYTNNNNSKLEYSSAKQFFDLIDYFFKDRKCVFEEGILAMVGISQVVSITQSESFLPKIMPYIFYAIDEYKDFQTCKAALTCLPRLIQNNKQNFESFIEKLINKFENLMKQADANREIFSYISIIYSECFSAIGEPIWKYAPNILNYMNNAINICIQTSQQYLNSNDEDGYQYYIDFNNNLIDLISNIVQKLSNEKQERKEVFKQYMKNILDYLKFMFNIKDFNPKKEYILDCIAVLFDLVDIYQEQFVQALEDNTLKKISQMAEKSNDDEIMKLMEALQDQIIIIRFKSQKDNIF